jgi:hypothetical protein
MKNTLASALVLAGAVAAFSGCQSPGAKPPINATKYDYENQLNFVLLDSGAQRSVTSSGIQERRLADGRLEVAANVRNRQNRRIQVQINCEFKDAQGFVVDSTPFENLFLDENAQQTVRFTSMNAKAERYTVRVRQAR